MDRRRFLQITAAAAAMHAPLIDGVAQEDASSQVWKKRLHLHELRLCSNRLDEQEAYYREVLRMPVERRSADELHVRAGSSSIVFYADPEQEDPFYHVAFTIPQNKLDEAHAWLAPRCAIMDINPRGDKVMHFENWNAHSIFFLDPADNILEFIAHHDLGDDEAKSFDESQIRYISEIGVVVPDVAVFAAEAKTRFDLEAYRGSSRVFAPLGDIGGLLITVQEGRGWFPSRRRNAVIYPTEVHMTGLAEPATWHPPDLPYALSNALQIDILD